MVDSDESFAERVKEIIGYLLNEGIPEDARDISELVDDEKGGSDYKKPDFSPGISANVKFDSKKFNQMIQQVKIEIIEEEKRIQTELEENLERDKINSMDWLDLMNSKSI